MSASLCMHGLLVCSWLLSAAVSGLAKQRNGLVGVAAVLFFRFVCAPACLYIGAGVACTVLPIMLQANSSRVDFVRAVVQPLHQQQQLGGSGQHAAAVWQQVSETVCNLHNLVLRVVRAQDCITGIQCVPALYLQYW